MIDEAAYPKRAPNRKGRSAYQFNQLETAFIAKGEVRCKAGLTPREVLTYVAENDADLYQSICQGKPGCESDPLKYISQTLHDYSQQNDHRVSYGRKPFFQLSAKGKHRRFTLKQEVWAEYRRKKANDQQRMRRRTVAADITKWEGTKIQRLNTQAERHSDISKLFKRRLLHYRCEVCEFDFEAVYGMCGKRYIEAHHKYPLCLGERESTLDDFNAVCANCHRMLHHGPNPFKTVEQLSRIVNRLK